MAEETVPIDRLMAWLGRYAELIGENKAYLTELDSAIGDADHGINMDRGMTAVMGKLEAEPAAAIDQLFKATGMTLVTTVGGAAGPLYGTFFLRFATAVPDAKELTPNELAGALAAGLQGVIDRGKAHLGEKTMVDALTPAVDEFAAAVGEGSATIADAVRRAAVAAEVGREATEPMVATKGRASYLGERSAGHLDPGATSSALLFQALAETVGTVLAGEP